MDLQTMAEGTRLFRLTDPAVTNDKLAEVLQLRRYKDDQHGQPGCCFWGGDRNVPVVAIRLSGELLAVMVLFQSISDQLVRNEMGTPVSWEQMLFVPRKR